MGGELANASFWSDASQSVMTASRNAVVISLFKESWLPEKLRTLSVLKIWGDIVSLPSAIILHSSQFDLVYVDQRKVIAIALNRLVTQTP